MFNDGQGQARPLHKTAPGPALRPHAVDGVGGRCQPATSQPPAGLISQMSPPTASTLTDQQLVERVLRGDTAAFGHIVRRTEGLVAQLVFKMIRHPADRPDLAQEVYLKAYKNLAGFKFQAKLSTWIGQIAYHTCLHYLEKKQLVLLDDRHSEADGPADHATPHAPDTPESLFVDQQRTAILHEEIDRLPPLFRTLVALYHQQELSYAEIAQITALPEGTIKSYLFRARRTLQQQVLARYYRDDL